METLLDEIKSSDINIRSTALQNSILKLNNPVFFLEFPVSKKILSVTLTLLLINFYYFILVVTVLT